MPCTEYISELKKKKEVKRMEVSVLPNWCYTEYAFYGDDAAVKRLGSDIKRFTSKNYMENGFGKNWLGNIVLGYGFHYEGSSFIFRGSITELEENGGVLYVATETAWGPMTEMWDAIFDRHFQSDDDENQIGYVFRAEEPGNGVYINTDTKGCFFLKGICWRLKECWNIRILSLTICRIKRKLQILLTEYLVQSLRPLRR